MANQLRERGEVPRWSYVVEIGGKSFTNTLGRLQPDRLEA
jgi:hypothetical protein